MVTFERAIDIVVALAVVGVLSLVIPFIRRWAVDRFREMADQPVDVIHKLDQVRIEQKKQYEAELTKRDAEIAELRRQVNYLLNKLARAEREIEELKKRTEFTRDIAPPMAPQVLLICGTDDRFCRADQQSLNRAGIRYERLQVVNRQKIQDEFRRKREDRRPWKLVHISAHADDTGILLADGVAAPSWWADQMEGVTVCVLAACETMAVADAIAGVVHYVLAIREQIDNADAAQLTFSFWRAVRDGQHVTDAFEAAIQETPQIRPYVTLRQTV